MYENYERIRNTKGYKDSDVSKATGVAKSTFSDWKNGRSKPKTDKLIKIAKFLDVSVEQLEFDNIAWDPDSQDIYLVEEIPSRIKAKYDFLVNISSSKFGQDYYMELLDIILEVDERYKNDLLSLIKIFAKVSKGE